jgi:hypothetical protein
MILKFKLHFSPNRTSFCFSEIKLHKRCNMGILDKKVHRNNYPWDGRLGITNAKKSCPSNVVSRKARIDHCVHGHTTINFQYAQVIVSRLSSNLFSIYLLLETRFLSCYINIAITRYNYESRNKRKC